MIIQDPSTHMFRQVQDTKSCPSFNSTYLILQKIIEQYWKEPDKLMEPWAMRASYALAVMLKSATHAPDPLPPQAYSTYQLLTLAADNNFEPAVWELIRLFLKHDKKITCEFEHLRIPFIRACKCLKKYTSTGISLEPQDQIIDDSCIIIDFFNKFGHYVKNCSIMQQAWSNAKQALEKIVHISEDYRARCLLAIMQLTAAHAKSIDDAYAYLEPVITNPQAQLFFAERSSKAIRDFLQENSPTNPNAAFLLGFLLFTNKETRVQAYHYLTQAAEQNHFYALCSIASMIKKGFDPQKTIPYAVLYYKQALVCAPDQRMKTQVLETLKTMAEESIPAKCELLLALMADQKLQECDALLQTIEKYPQEEFDKYIDYCRTYCDKTIWRQMAEENNSTALRLLGYMHYAKAQESPDNQIWQLHTSLGKLELLAPLDAQPLLLPTLHIHWACTTDRSTT